MKTLCALLLFTITTHLGTAAEYYHRKANPSMIRIVGVPPTPEPDNVQNMLVFPKNGELLYRTPTVQSRLMGFPTGTNSDFDRQNQIYNDPEGQSLLIFVDNHHPIEIYKSFVDALDPNNLYYDITLTTRIPFHLGEGMHVIRSFPDRSYGESLKSPGCYAAAVFYIGEKKDNLDVNLNGPYLTYNEPLETLRYNSSKPILLDFYLSNVQLSRDGFKVRVTINDDVQRTLTRWVPYYIYGLQSGKHSIRLQLINEKNQVVPGLFNDVERMITIN